jgi:hypothetical protein
MGGLSSSTLLTLVVIPALYLLLPGRVQAAWRGAPDVAPTGTAAGSGPAETSVAGAPVEDRPNPHE